MRKLTIIVALMLIMNLTACTPKNQTSATTVPTTTKPTTAAATTVATTTPATTAATTAATTQATTKATTTAGTTKATTTVATTKGINILTGTFQKAEWGDYLHITIKGDDGKDYNFFVIKYPGIEVETLKVGQKVKVTWQNVDELLSPPGKIVNFDKVISIELVK